MNLSDHLNTAMQRVARELYPLRCRYEFLTENSVCLSIYHAVESMLIYSCSLSFDDLNDSGRIDHLIQQILVQADQRLRINQD